MHFDPLVTLAAGQRPLVGGGSDTWEALSAGDQALPLNWDDVEELAALYARISWRQESIAT
jgi:hypothetical protein